MMGEVKWNERGAVTIAISTDTILTRVEALGAVFYQTVLSSYIGCSCFEEEEQASRRERERQTTRLDPPLFVARARDHFRHAKIFQLPVELSSSHLAPLLRSTINPSFARAQRLSKRYFRLAFEHFLFFPSTTSFYSRPHPSLPIHYFITFSYTPSFYHFSNHALYHPNLSSQRRPLRRRVVAYFRLLPPRLRL